MSMPFHSATTTLFFTVRDDCVSPSRRSLIFIVILDWLKCWNFVTKLKNKGADSHRTKFKSRVSHDVYCVQWPKYVMSLAVLNQFWENAKTRDGPVEYSTFIAVGRSRAALSSDFLKALSYLMFFSIGFRIMVVSWRWCMSVRLKWRACDTFWK